MTVMLKEFHKTEDFNQLVWNHAIMFTSNKYYLIWITSSIHSQNLMHATGGSYKSHFTLTIFYGSIMAYLFYEKEKVSNLILRKNNQ